VAHRAGIQTGRVSQTQSWNADAWAMPQPWLYDCHRTPNRDSIEIAARRSLYIPRWTVRRQANAYRRWTIGVGRIGGSSSKGVRRTFGSPHGQRACRVGVLHIFRQSSLWIEINTGCSGALQAIAGRL